MAMHLFLIANIVSNWHQSALAQDSTTCYLEAQVEVIKKEERTVCLPQMFPEQIASKGVRHTKQRKGKRNGRKTYQEMKEEKGEEKNLAERFTRERNVPTNDH